MQRNIIVDSSFRFALKIIEFSELLEAKRKFVISNQVLKAGCSIGANVREAQNAESKMDFVHKLKIAIKEAEETEYWLLLCKYAENYPDSDELLNDIQGIIKILGKIISTTKKQLKIG